MGKIRSRLVKFAVKAQDRENPGNWQEWEITLQGNRIAEDKADWLKTAAPYFSDITLTKITAAKKRQDEVKASKADIAREGLALLDKILANRTNNH